MKLAAIAGFAAGTAIVLVIFFRELSTRAAARRVSEQEQQEAAWRLFLQRWEAA